MTIRQIALLTAGLILAVWLAYRVGHQTAQNDYLNLAKDCRSGALQCQN